MNLREVLDELTREFDLRYEITNPNGMGDVFLLRTRGIEGRKEICRLKGDDFDDGNITEQSIRQIIQEWKEKHNSK